MTVQETTTDLGPTLAMAPATALIVAVEMMTATVAMMAATQGVVEAEAETMTPEATTEPS